MMIVAGAAGRLGRRRARRRRAVPARRAGASPRASLRAQPRALRRARGDEPRARRVRRRADLPREHPVLRELPPAQGARHNMCHGVSWWVTHVLRELPPAQDACHSMRHGVSCCVTHVRRELPPAQGACCADARERIARPIEPPGRVSWDVPPSPCARSARCDARARTSPQGAIRTPWSPLFPVSSSSTCRRWSLTAVAYAGAGWDPPLNPTVGRRPRPGRRL